VPGVDPTVAKQEIKYFVNYKGQHFYRNPMPFAFKWGHIFKIMASVALTRGHILQKVVPVALT